MSEAAASRGGRAVLRLLTLAAAHCVSPDDEWYRINNRPDEMRQAAMQRRASTLLAGTAGAPRSMAAPRQKATPWAMADSPSLAAHQSAASAQWPPPAGHPLPAGEFLPDPPEGRAIPNELRPGTTPPKDRVSLGSYMTPAGRKYVRINETAIAQEKDRYHIANEAKDPGPPYDPVTDAHAKEWIDLPTLILKGERHTGTNLLQSIITTNLGYDGQVLDLDATYRFCFSPPEVRNGTNCCWKHGFVDDKCDRAYKSSQPAFLLLVRSVYPWLVAMHREPYEYNGPNFPAPYNQSDQNFSAFLRAPANYERVWLADHPSNAYRMTSKYDGVYLVEPYQHANPIVMWRDKMKSYLNLRTPKVLVTHDDMYDQQKLSDKLNGLTEAGFHYKKDAYDPQTKLFAYPPMDDSDDMGDKYTQQFTRKKFEASKADSDASKHWLSEFTQAPAAHTPRTCAPRHAPGDATIAARAQEDLDFVNSHISEELMHALDLEFVRFVPGGAPSATLKAHALAAPYSRDAGAFYSSGLSERLFSSFSMP